MRTRTSFWKHKKYFLIWDRHIPSPGLEEKIKSKKFVLNAGTKLWLKMNFTHLTDRLSKYRNDKIVFVGLGNELRGDDLAGLVFIDTLKTKTVFNKSKFIIAGKNPENYLQEILGSNPEAVVFIDAADWGGEPGDISFLEADSIASGDFSTHAYSIKLLEQFLSLNMPMDFVYIGIQSKTTALGKEMSSQVNHAIKEFFTGDEQI